MNILKGITKYIIIIFIGVLLAFFVAWIQYDSQDLAASVLSLTEQDFFESTQRDAGYKKENQIFEVFLAEQVRNQGQIEVSILYSPKDFEYFLDKMETNYTISGIQENEGNLVFNIDGYENGDFSEGIFQLPYSGDIENVTLEYIKSEKLNYAIGSLDNVDNENHNH